VSRGREQQDDELRGRVLLHDAQKYDCKKIFVMICDDDDEKHDLVISSAAAAAAAAAAAVRCRCCRHRRRCCNSCQSAAGDAVVCTSFLGLPYTGPDFMPGQMGKSKENCQNLRNVFTEAETEAPSIVSSTRSTPSLPGERRLPVKLSVVMCLLRMPAWMA